MMTASYHRLPERLRRVAGAVRVSEQFETSKRYEARGSSFLPSHRLSYSVIQMQFHSTHQSSFFKPSWPINVHSQAGALAETRLGAIPTIPNRIAPTKATTATKTRILPIFIDFPSSELSEKTSTSGPNHIARRTACQDLLSSRF